MKNYTKQSINSKWLEIIKYERTEEELAICHKDGQLTQEDYDVVKAIREKSRKEADSEDVEMLNNLYIALVGVNNVDDVKSMSMHVTVENNQKRGVLSFSTSENGEMTNIRF